MNNLPISYSVLFFLIIEGLLLRVCVCVRARMYVCVCKGVLQRNDFLECLRTERSVEAFLTQVDSYCVKI